MIAFNEAASGIDGANLLTIAIGNRAALHHNCTTHRCDPGYGTLAAEMGTSRRTVLRHLTLLEDTGWLQRKRGGRDDKVSIILCIPDAANRSPAPDLAPENHDRIGDTILSPMDARNFVPSSASIGDKNGFHR